MSKIIVKNKTASFNYHLVTKYEAGIELQGWEVKSIRQGHVRLKGSFISFKNNEPFITNMYIGQYMNVVGDYTASRKLLLSKFEIKKLQAEVETKGLTIVPTVLKITNRGWIKVDIALARGKNLRDKRQTIKERDQKRNLKQYY